MTSAGMHVETTLPRGDEGTVNGIPIPFTDNRMKTTSILLEGRDAICCMQPKRGARTGPSTSLWGHYAPYSYQSGMHCTVRPQTSSPEYEDAYAERQWSKSSREYGYMAKDKPKVLGYAKRITKWDISDSHPFRTHRIVPEYKNLSTTYMELGNCSKSARACV